MGHTSVFQPKLGIAITSISADEPPGAPASELVDITSLRNGPSGSRRLALFVKGDNAADQTFTAGAKVWGKNALVMAGTLFVIATIPSGTIISSTKGYYLPLPDDAIAICESIGVSGALSIGNGTGLIAPVDPETAC